MPDKKTPTYVACVGNSDVGSDDETQATTQEVASPSYIPPTQMSSPPVTSSSITRHTPLKAFTTQEVASPSYIPPTQLSSPPVTSSSITRHTPLKALNSSLEPFSLTNSLPPDTPDTEDLGKLWMYLFEYFSLYL